MISAIRLSSMLTMQDNSDIQKKAVLLNLLVGGVDLSRWGFNSPAPARLSQGGTALEAIICIWYRFLNFTFLRNHHFLSCTEWV